MQVYKTPLKAFRFALEACEYNKQVHSMDAFKDYDLEMVLAMVEQTGRLCEERMLPLNGVGDRQGVSLDPETHDVKTPDGFKELYDATREQGTYALCQPTQWGGFGAPLTLNTIICELATSTNKSFSMCPGLTQAAIDALVHHGSDWQQKTFLPKLVSGEWTGTMCLTEPQCGTDLGLLTTKAEPEEDYYRLTGTKIWITFGEHDLADNIIHLVLARLPGAPEGIKGISLFIVPKFDLDGSRNPIFCTGLEHKMGIHASPTCVMSLENAKGWLVGEENKGMQAMFTMMNDARLLVGVEGISLGEIAYQTALEFSKDRRQGRSLDKAKRDPNAKADVIMVHPDVRRMFLNIKSTTEAMRTFALWTSIQRDIANQHADEAERKKADDIIALLTPVIKSFMTEVGFQNIHEAMQICGGAGYITDWPIEQYMRDERIALIYEGTNHVQALDLVGRKLPKGNGRLLMAFNSKVTDFIRSAKEVEGMDEFLKPLKEASKTLQNLTMGMSMKAMQDHEYAAAVATPYLNFFGYTCLCFAWALEAKLALSRPDDRYAQTKLATARYFYAKVLPETAKLAKVIEAGKANIMDFDIDDF